VTTRITQVDAYVWRGARPQSSEYAEIKAKFATVISLEGEAEDMRESDELAPVHVVSRPITFWEIYWSGITQSHLIGILQSITAAPKPVLIHCEHGEDRTGLVVAAWRVYTGEMSPSQAWAEALAFGYREVINFGLNKTWAAYTRGEM
jgi:tyrosine-protein phosphatase SIW14